MEDKDKTKEQLVKDLAHARRQIADMQGRLRLLEAAEGERKWAEETYCAFVNHSLQGLLILQGGCVVFANPAFARMSGYTVGELLSFSPAEIEAIVPPEGAADVPPEDRMAVWEHYRGGLAAGGLDRYECRGLRKDGTVIWVEMRANRIEYRGKPAIQITVVDITERRQAEAEQERLLAQIQEQAHRVQQILDTVPEGVLLLDGSGQVVQTNPLGERDLAVLADVREGDTLTHLGDLPLAELLASHSKGLWHKVVVDGRNFQVIARPIETGHTPLRTLSRSGAGGWVVVIRDVTRERDMQQRVQRQDRLAVIGQLAGGVAHDFNNVLTAIQGFAGLILYDLGPDDPIRADLEELTRAADRAAALTRQLLAFSRKQVLQPVALDLNAVIADMEKMLRRLIGEDVELAKALSPDLGRVMADPGQIEQVIMNLAVNARDAMPRGGRLLLETGNVVLDRAYAQIHSGAEPGTYAMLAVSDTGTGMSEEVRSRIFEPFYTTKKKGEGTGLGLCTVHGIVAQSGGHVEVYSEPGMGTSFKVYLPRIEASVESARESLSPEALPRGTETILLAEDDRAIRELAQRALAQYGYTVLEAHRPDQALHLSDQHDGPIPLLVTDVVMPRMGGPELAKQLAVKRPEIKVLYISGYTDDAIAHHGVLGPELAFLEKPFTPLALARKVREVLDLPALLADERLIIHKEIQV